MNATGKCEDVVTSATTMDQQSPARFAELLESNRRLVFKVANTYCRNPADRDDLVQEIVIQTWRAFPRYDASRKFSTWLYRIALNVAISFVRSSAVRGQLTVPLVETHYDVSGPPTGPYDSDHQIRLLYDFIDQLDELNRALVLLYLDEYSYRDIAEILGITETNVATKINRLKQRLRRDLIAT